MAKSKDLRAKLLGSSKAAIEAGRSSVAGVAEQSGAIWLPVAEIAPDPDQPRTHYDDTAMAQLCDSIRSLGQIEPILVQSLRADERVSAPGRKYRCLSGHRRLRAHEMLGLAEIKATTVRESLGATERLMHEIASNEAREDHTDYDRARFLAQLFADRLAVATPVPSGDDSESIARVKYLINKAFNEFDRQGAFSPEARKMVAACEDALKAIGERRNLRWFHRWGLPLLALDGAARTAAHDGLDARRTLTIAQLGAGAGKAGAADNAYRDGVIARLASIAVASHIPHRDLSLVVKELRPLVELGPAAAAQVNAVLDRLAASDVDAETVGDAGPQAASSPGAAARKGNAKPDAPDMRSLKARARSLSKRWIVTAEAPDSARRAKPRQRTIAELLDEVPAGQTHRLNRLLGQLERADRELVALLAAGRPRKS
ncbi:MAG TPA: ParB/RepB/Spo0J family partition protein [Blastocatellia bacterium]|nr:ParB/RepB/Spo0J family partition protein [Blastocatellia bacterium]